jgi:hypothetical protein
MITSRVCLNCGRTPNWRVTHHEGVGVLPELAGAMARRADLKLALRALALPARALWDVPLAGRAGRWIGRVIGVVEVEECHHRRVLCAAQGVKLQVVRLAEREVRCSRVKDVAHLLAILHHARTYAWMLCIFNMLGAE